MGGSRIGSEILDCVSSNVVEQEAFQYSGSSFWVRRLDSSGWWGHDRRWRWKPNVMAGYWRLWPGRLEWWEQNEDVNLLGRKVIITGK